MIHLQISAVLVDEFGEDNLISEELTLKVNEETMTAIRDLEAITAKLKQPPRKKPLLSMSDIEDNVKQKLKTHFPARYQQLYGGEDV